MKKRILSLFLVLTLIFSLSACNNNVPNGENSTQTESENINNNQDADGDSGKSENSQSKETENGTEGGNENSDSNADGTQTEDSKSENDKAENSEGKPNNSNTDKTDSSQNGSDLKNDSNKNESNKNDSGTNNDKTPSGSGTNTDSGSNTGSGSDTNNDSDSGSENNNNTGNNNSGSITTNYISSFTAKENELADAVIAKIITSGMGEFEKVKAIHDYLVMNVDYDYQNYLNDTIPMDSHKAIGALQNKIAVCDGYSYAFQLLCLKAGVSCELVTGMADESSTGKQIGHAWNQVKIEGKWYNIDVTWDDPATVNGEILAFNDHSGCSYEYFCVPDSIIYRDHVADDAKYTCTSSCLFERALKVGVPWDDAKYVASETELINLLKTEAQKNNASPSFYIKGSTISGDTATFFSKCMSKAGIDFSNGYSWAYYTYFEGTTDPGVYYKFTLSLVTDGSVVTHPVVSTMAELKAELLKAYQAGETSCLVYYYTNLIVWDNYDSTCANIIYAESGYYTGISTYWPTDSTEIPQLTQFVFY